jgi:hypothetical protein
MNISKQIGDSPFRAAVLNFLYTQDPVQPDKVRIQAFIASLIDFIEQVKDMPDPENPPKVYEVGISEKAIEEIKTIKARRTGPTMEEVIAKSQQNQLRAAFNVGFETDPKLLTPLNADAVALFKQLDDEDKPSEPNKA